MTDTDDYQRPLLSAALDEAEVEIERLRAEVERLKAEPYDLRRLFQKRGERIDELMAIPPENRHR